MDLIDSDPRRSAAHRNLIAHLPGPFAGGALDTPIDLVAQGDAVTGRVDWSSRQPLLLLGARVAVGARGISLSIEVTPQGQPKVTTTLELAPFTEQSAFVPAWPNTPLPDPELTPPLDIVVHGPPDLALTETIELRLVEGTLGRLLYVIGSEKARLRRQARELEALRHARFELDASYAHHRRVGHALDRLGADLGVPRFTDRLAWDTAHQQPLSTNEREPDEAYRQRLLLYRPMVVPTKSAVEATLDALSSAAAFTVQEPNCEFAVAIKLIASPDNTPRKNFLDALRASYLLQPGQPVPATRLLPRVVRAAQEARSTRVGAAFAVPANAYVAPLLLDAMDRAGRCRVALGVSRPWKVLRAQDDNGGSRYELGLGIDVEPLPAAELAQLVTAARAKAYPPTTDVETRALLDSLSPEDADKDPNARWLLAACGFKTVHTVAADRVYLSHFPAFGAVMTAGSTPLDLQVSLEGPGDPGQNAALWYGIRATAAAVTAATPAVPAWTELSATAARAALNTAVRPPDAAIAAVTSAGLRTPSAAADLQRAVADLQQQPPELLTVLRLDPAMAAGLRTGTPAATAQLAVVVNALATNELVSALPIFTATDVLLVVGIVALPGSATILSSKRLGFRWYVLPVTGEPGHLDRAAGSRSRYTPKPGPSLAAVVAVTLARSDREDPRGCVPPYSVRLDLAGDTLIDLPTFERMMNFLERAAPLGVVVNTAPVRERHVDPANSGHAIPLVGRLAHAFREFQQYRHLGAVPTDRNE